MKKFIASALAPLLLSLSAICFHSVAHAQTPTPTAVPTVAPTAVPVPTPTTGPIEGVPPVIGIVVNPNPLRENGGEQAATGTIRRYYTSISSPLTVNLQSDMPQTLRLPRSVTIASGQTSVDFPIGAIDDTVLNGSRVALVTATARGFFDAMLGVGISDDESAFDFTIAPTEIRENDGRAVGTLTRSDNLSNRSETVSLSVPTNSGISIPDTVTFPTGSSTATFEIKAIDDDLFNGRRNVTITARRGAATDLTAPSATATITLIDDEYDLNLRLDRNTAREGEGFSGPTVLITRTRGAADIGPVTISLSSSDSSEIIAPVGLNLIKGQREIRARLQVVDDGLVDGPQRVQLTASADAYNSASGEIVVNDNDAATLEFNLTANKANESEIPARIVGRLRRNTPSERALTVAIGNSAPTRVRTPSTVTFAPGAVRVEFPIQVIDNTVRDGDVSARLSVSAPSFARVEQTLNVLDNDGPSLEVSFEKLEMLEGTREEKIGRVTRRNAPLNSALLVNLSSSDASVLRTYATVVIAAGQQSATFAVDATNDDLPTDLRTAVVEASVADGSLARGAAPLDVMDNEDDAVLKVRVDSLKPTGLTFPPQVFVGPSVFEDGGFGAVRVTITANTAPDSDVLVLLQSTGDLIIPDNLVLPFGTRTLSFLAAPIDDELRCLEDKDVVSSVMANVAGYKFVIDQKTIAYTDGQGKPATTLQKANEIIVVDNDSTDGCSFLRKVRVDIEPRVEREPEGIAEGDGQGAAKVFVRRSDDAPELELVVDLTTSLPDDTVLEKQRVVLPPYSQRAYLEDDDNFPYAVPPVEVRLDALDNATIDDCRNVTITPTVVGFRRPGSDVIIPVEDFSSAPTSPVGLKFAEQGDSVQFYDNEAHIGPIMIVPSVISETAASGVATGTITRLRRADGTFLPGAINVTLRSSDTTEVGVSPTGRTDPQGTLSVTLPANLNAISFNVIAIDDDIADGTQAVSILGSIDCSIAQTPANVLVRDNDTPTLTMRLTPNLPENAPADQVRASVARNTPTDKALVVSLRCSNPRRFNLPPSVTIPAGQKEVEIPNLSMVNDTLSNGDEILKVAASAAGHVSAVAQAKIVDDEKPVVR